MQLRYLYDLYRGRGEAITRHDLFRHLRAGYDRLPWFKGELCEMWRALGEGKGLSWEHFTRVIPPGHVSIALLLQDMLDALPPPSDVQEEDGDLFSLVSVDGQYVTSRCSCTSILPSCSSGTS